MSVNLSIRRIRRKHLIWIGLGLLSLLLGLLLKWSPSIAESFYGRGLYIGIRWLLSNTIGRLPLPGITLIFLCCILLFWQTAIKALRKRTWTWLSLIGGLLATLASFVFLFQLLWGFNYFRPTWDERLGIASDGMTAQELAAEFHRTTIQLKLLTDTLKDVSILDHRTPREHEAAMAPVLRKVLETHHFPLSKDPRVRIVKPKGILMRWNTAGIYVPYSGESHIDGGMLPVQIPFTLAHEMAHGYGVTDEGDCNFLAYLTCRSSGEIVVRFTGMFSYWRYVAGEYRYAFPEEFDKEFAQMPQLVRQLLADIRANDAKYPDLFPKLRNTIYDTYLKSQGVHDGLMSYNRVVQLVARYENLDSAD